ncbi:MAG: allophycocyanin subunit beta, partial [cyanobacterium endosymbiont of Rhopalodia inflata]
VFPEINIYKNLSCSAFLEYIDYYLLYTSYDLAFSNFNVLDKRVLRELCNTYDFLRAFVS